MNVENDKKVADKELTNAVLNRANAEKDKNVAEKKHKSAV